MRDILDPMIRAEHFPLSSEDQTFTATWASKCAYAYAAPVEAAETRRQRVHHRGHPHLARHHRPRMLQFFAITPGTGKSHLLIALAAAEA